MAFDVTFLIALTCLLSGVGCFKGNLASQVGGFTQPATNRRADGVSDLLHLHQWRSHRGPLIAGTLGEKVGWHWVSALRRRHADRAPPSICQPEIIPARPTRPWSKKKAATRITPPKRN